MEALADAPLEDLNQIFAAFGVSVMDAIPRGAARLGGPPGRLGLAIAFRVLARFLLDLQRI